MVATPVPAGRSLLGKIAVSAQLRARARGKSSRVAAFVGEHVMTVAAMAAVDTGMWHLGPVAGWVSVAVSLLIIDFKLQG